ncbi:sensitivity to high expression protein she9 [Mortierella sp. GBA30]|nr:sensitivity to high expression protein she9 [Mortierella sp. GBA30]
MASNLCLIRQTGALTRSQTLLFRSSLRPPFPNRCTVTPQGVVGTHVAKRAFSASIASRNNGNNISQSPSNGITESKDVGEKSRAVSEVTEEEAKNKLAAEAERKRIEVQDAALKEILESAAAEKRKLEEEAIRAAEEKARKAALEAEEAARARVAKAKAEAEAKAKLETAKLAKEMQRQRQQLQQESEISSIQASATVPSASSSPVVSSSPNATMGNSLGDNSPTDARRSAAVLRQPSSVRKEGYGGQANETISQSSIGEDPLEPFKARLLPYKRSLESSTEYLRSVLPDNLRQLSESVKRKDYHDTIAQLSGHLNTFTGYNAINDLKHMVITHGDSLDEARIKLAQAKQAYEDAIGTRSNTQKAINDLLQRKHLWSPDDVIRFTDLYRSEHANEQAEQKTKAQYKQAEAEVEDKSRQLTRVIMERYHEEQVWSDKIRAASTYGTWGLVGVNVMAFLIVQAFVEPRRRRKQVERYEELVQDLTERGILPDKSLVATISNSEEVPAMGQRSSDAPVLSTKETTKVAIGGALLGGEDMLLKMIQSAERQEERLDRMENLLLKQIPEALDDNDSIDILQPQENCIEKAGEMIVADDGTVLFVPEDEDDESGLVYMGEVWREETNRGSRTRGTSELAIDAAHLDSTRPGNRLSRVLKDGDAEVLATRRDFLLSGLSGAIIGGLVTVAVMMNR